MQWYPELLPRYKTLVIMMALAIHVSMWCSERIQRTVPKQLPGYALERAVELHRVTSLSRVLCELVTEYECAAWKLQKALPIRGKFGTGQILAITQMMYKKNPILMLGAGENIWMCGLNDGKIRAKLTGHTMRIYDVVYVPEENILISGSGDSTVKLWTLNLEDLQQSYCHKTLTNHSAGINAIKVSPCKTKFASASDDRTIRIWSLPEGELLNVLPGENTYAENIAWSHDGKSLYSGMFKGEIWTWELPTVPQKCMVVEIWNASYKFAYCPLQHYLATHFSGEAICLREPTRGGKIRTMEESVCDGLTGSIAFSPSGMFLAAICCSRKLKIWDTLTGKLIMNDKHQALRRFTLYFLSDDVLITQADKPATLNVYCLTDIRSSNS